MNIDFSRIKVLCNDSALSSPVRHSLSRKYRADPNGPVQEQFVRLRSMDLGVEYIDCGKSDDMIVAGNYEGDQKTDIAIWRPSSDPNSNYFYVVRSSDKTTETSEWGQFRTPGVDCDAPLANWNVH